MIDRDLKAFLDADWKKWKNCRKTVGEISRSKPDDPKTALVKSDFETYSFDDMVKALFNGKNQCASADALYIGPDILNPDDKKKKQSCVYLIEFKPRSLDEGEELKKSIDDSLYLKAVESYVVLSGVFFPRCRELPKPQRLVFWIVTNMRSRHEGTNIAKKRKSQSNNTKTKDPRAELRGEVNRLKKEITGGGFKQPYIYDDIRIIEIEEFKEYLQSFL